MKYIELLFLFFIVYINSLFSQTVRIEALGLFLDSDPKSFHDQWMEIKNISGRPADVSGWKIKVDGKGIYTFPPSAVILPGGSRRINIVSDPGRSRERSKNDNIIFCPEPFFKYKVLTDNEIADYLSSYEQFRVYHSVQEKEKLNEKFLRNLRVIPRIFMQIELMNSESNREDAVLLTSTFINKNNGFSVGDLGRFGLAPVKILIRSGSVFENRQVLQYDDSFELKELCMGTKLLYLSIVPTYFMMEQGVQVSVRIFENQDEAKILLDKTSSFAAGQGICISEEEVNKLVPFIGKEVSITMQITAPDYRSNILRKKIELKATDSLTDLLKKSSAGKITAGMVFTRESMDGDTGEYKVSEIVYLHQ